MAKKNIFGKVTAYQTFPFRMAFVCLMVVLFIDHYCAGAEAGAGEGGCAGAGAGGI